MAKVIILGMNRTGTKLASFLASKHFGLKNVFLEPFTWNQGIDASLSDDWQPQQQLRKRSKDAQTEHKRLNVISGLEDNSDWLEQVLTSGNWDVFKFIEIGRAELIYRYAKNASYILLIRDPISYLESISGMPEARLAVIEQARRLIIEENTPDPLPSANKYLDEEIADCARAYCILYQRLSKFQPDKFIKVSYDELAKDPTQLKELATDKMPFIPDQSTPPMLGASTKTQLSTEAKLYISDTLGVVYRHFLNS